MVSDYGPRLETQIRVPIQLLNLVLNFNTQSTTNEWAHFGAKENVRFSAENRTFLELNF